MIEVIYRRGENKLTVRGHAGNGDRGHDLVCASASILTYTLAAFVRSTYKARQTKKPVIKLEAGDAEISCRARPKFRLAITLVFDAICGGYELLAKNYPANIVYRMEL